MFKNFLLFSLVGLSLPGFAQSSCVRGSELWKWTEGRQKPIEASAKCSGKFFEKKVSMGDIEDARPMADLDGVPAATVSVLSSETLFISDTENSRAKAEVETAERLRDACARLVIEHFQGRAAGYFGKHSLLDIKKLIDLEPTNLGKVAADYGFSYRPVDLKESQKAALTSRLNAVNSCSTFTTVDATGKLLLSNCDQTGIGLETTKAIQKFESGLPERKALAAVAGALANVIRGGEKPFQLGSTQGARGLASLIFASIDPLVKKEFNTETLMHMSETVARGMLAMMLYQTHGMIGHPDPAKGFATGVVENAILGGILCGPDCAKTSPASAAAYTLSDVLARKKDYKLLNMNANEVAEIVTGAILGYAMANTLAEKEHKALRAKLDAEKLRALISSSSQDICLDVVDVIHPESSQSGVSARTAGSL